MDRSMRAAKAIATALRDLDPRLELQYFKEGCRPRNVVIGRVIPGRWHVVRRNDPPAPDIPYPIVTDSGGYRDPDSGVIMEMQQRDLWKFSDPVPKDEPEKERDDSIDEEIVSDIRAYGRLTGDGGINRRVRGKK